MQVACPPGGEDAARRFYTHGLGLVEVEKPDLLKPKGGAWFRAFDPDGVVTAEIHVGVEDPFTPARKAHPAILLDRPGDLEPLASRLTELGYAVDLSERDTFPGYQRFHTVDGAGNRVEVLAPLP